MQPTEFLRAVLPDEGYYCLFAANSAADARRQKFYSSPEALFANAQRANDAGYDVYFALASFNEAGSRKAENAVSMRAFFLDLDCGPGKPFRTQTDAIAKLSAFRRAIGLPAPILVSSGYGVHVYWPLEEAVPVSDWARATKKLKAMCDTHKLEADPAVTLDKARVLRIPGTDNHKKETLAQVEIVSLAQSAISFEDFAAAVGAKAGIEQILRPTEGMKDAMARTEKSLAAMDSIYKYSFADIVRRSKRGNGCAQIINAIVNQATLEEPLWRAALSIASVCEDGVASAHKMSRRHPDYSPEETEKKLSEIQGPYGCDKFKQLNPEGCKNCPVAKKCTNPIQLGRYIPERDAEDEVVEAVRPEGAKDFIGDEENATGIVVADGEQIVVPAYPEPFFNGPRNAVCIKKVDGDGEEYTHFVYRDPFYAVKRVKDPDKGEMVIMRLHLPRDGVQEFIVPLTSITSREEFRKCVAEHGITAHGDSLGLLVAYMVQWIEHLQNRESALAARRQFGWTGPASARSFVLGSKEYMPDGSVVHNPPSSSTAQFMGAFDPRGTLGEWKEVAEFFDRDGMEIFQFMMCAALGAPLMDLTGWNGLSINVFGKSGLGKTTIASAGLSVWGDPTRMKMHLNDTANSSMNRLEIFKNLPVLLDEITLSSEREVSELIFKVTAGQQKNRMSGKSNEERRRGEPWALLSFMTSNASAVELIRANKTVWDPEAQRLLEFHAAKYQFNDKAVTDQLTDKLNGVSGTAGPVFISYVVQNRQAVTELLRKVQRKVDAAAGLESENRYWSAAASVTMTALVLSKRLGLLTYDEKKLFNWVINMLKEHKASVNEGMLSPEQIIARYLAESQGRTLRIASTVRGKKIEDVSDLVDPERTPYNELDVRYETDRNVVFMDTKPLRKWCAKERIAYEPLVKALISSVGARSTMKRMGTGTSQALPPVWALEVPLLTDVLSEAVGGE